jgi:hypothetical protein
VIQLGKPAWLAAAAFATLLTVACGHEVGGSNAQQKISEASQDGTKPTLNIKTLNTEPAPPATETGGFDGNKAFTSLNLLRSVRARPPRTAFVERNSTLSRSCKALAVK